MRLIDADKLKAHYAWLNNEEQKLFDEIVNQQPSIFLDQLVYEKAAELVEDLRERDFIEYLSNKTWKKTNEIKASDFETDGICIFSDGETTFPGIIAVSNSKDGQFRLFEFYSLFKKYEDKEKKYYKMLPMFPPLPEKEISE